jgi:hypothetical protein
MDCQMVLVLIVCLRSLGVDAGRPQVRKCAARSLTADAAIRSPTGSYDYALDAIRVDMIVRSYTLPPFQQHLDFSKASVLTP